MKEIPEAWIKNGLDGGSHSNGSVVGRSLETENNSAAQIPPASDVHPAAITARAVEEAYATLVVAARYPNLPKELTHAYLSGIESSALSAEESTALKQEYEADLRLTALLDHFSTAMSSRQAKLLVKDKSLHQLIAVKTGHRSFSDFRGQQSGKGARAAAHELGIAETLDKTPSAQEAVDNGELTMDHVAVLSKATSRVARSGAKELTPEEKTNLVEMGKNRAADEFEKVVSRYVSGRDPVAHDASHAEIRRRRFLQVSYAPNGAHIKGFIDPVAAETLRVALEAATPRPSAGDDRDFGQRNADALVDIARFAMNAGDFKKGALVRPHLSFIMTESTFLDASKELKRRELVAAHKRGADQDRNSGQSPLGSSGRSPLDPALLEPVAMEPAEFEDGTAIPLNELTQLLCDTSVTRIVVNAEGTPTNLSKTERLYSKELRRAIITRDQSCRRSGCTIPARWSQIHHIKWWDRDDGETSIENGVLCCSFHHGQIHDGVLEVIRDEHGLPQIVLVEDEAEREEAPGRVTESKSDASEHVARESVARDLADVKGTTVPTTKSAKPEEYPEGLWDDSESNMNTNLFPKAQSQSGMQAAKVTVSSAAVRTRSGAGRIRAPLTGSEGSSRSLQSAQGTKKQGVKRQGTNGRSSSIEVPDYLMSDGPPPW